jgi:uncharacterized protein YjbI with pentapeptide repeats
MRALALACALAVLGCGGGDHPGDADASVPEPIAPYHEPRALHEHEFASRPDLRLRLGDLLMVELEHPAAAAVSEADSAAPGVDEVPLEVAEPTAVRFCLEAQGAEQHELAIVGADGTVLLRLTPAAGGACASAALPPGVLTVRLAHDGQGDPAAPAATYFLRPTAGDEAEGAAYRPRSISAWYLMQLNACRGCDLRNAQLQGIKLHGTDLTGALLGHAVLAGGVLSGVTVDGAELSGTSFTSAVITGGSFRNVTSIPSSVTCFFRASLSQVALDGAQLHGALFRGATLDEVSAHGASLAVADFQTSVVSNADFTDADLSGAAFDSATLASARFEGANLQAARFPGVKLYCGSFAGHDLRVAVFDAPLDIGPPVLQENDRPGCYVDLTGATLPYALVPPATWRYVALTDATLTDRPTTVPDLSNGTFKHARLGRVRGLSLAGAVLRHAQFDYADLTGMAFNHAALDGASFAHATLRATNFSEAAAARASFAYAHFEPDGASATAELSFGDFTNAVFTGAVLTGARLQYARIEGNPAALQGVTATDARFDGANLVGLDLASFKGVGASFSGAVLALTTLDGTVDLSAAELTGTVLCGASLSSTILNGANLTGAHAQVANDALPIPGLQLSIPCPAASIGKLATSSYLGRAATCPDGYPPQGPEEQCAAAQWSTVPPATTVCCVVPPGSTEACPARKRTGSQCTYVCDCYRLICTDHVCG